GPRSQRAEISDAFGRHWHGCAPCWPIDEHYRTSDLVNSRWPMSTVSWLPHGRESTPRSPIVRRGWGTSTSCLDEWCISEYRRRYRSESVNWLAATRSL